MDDGNRRTQSTPASYKKKARPVYDFGLAAFVEDGKWSI
jgi:hypothetical protein